MRYSSQARLVEVEVAFDLAQHLGRVAAVAAQFGRPLTLGGDDRAMSAIDLIGVGGSITAVVAACEEAVQPRVIRGADALGSALHDRGRGPGGELPASN